MQTSIPPEAKASVGLGLRRGLMKDLQAAPAGDFDFLEVAPELDRHRRRPRRCIAGPG